MNHDLVIISGYFNPLHIGHLEYIAEAKTLGERLLVIVNSDHQVKLKGSIPFMPQSERLKIIKSLDNVDFAVIANDRDRTVCESILKIKVLYPDLKLLFATGADHTEENTQSETLICNMHDIDIFYGIGGDKIQSSSKLLENVNG